MVVATVVVVLAGAGCSQEPTAEERRAQLAEDLVRETDGTLEPDTALCVADELFEEFGDDALRRVRAAAEGRDDAETRNRVIEVFDRCDALGPVLTEPGG